MSHLDNLPFDREIAIKINQHVDNIVGWAEARNIIKGSTPQAQFIKLVEEAGELVSWETYDDALDALGDCYVVSIILAAQFQTTALHTLLDVARHDFPEYRDSANRPFVFPDAEMFPEVLPSLGKVASTVARKNAQAFEIALYEFMRACLKEHYESFGGLSRAHKVEAALAHAWNEIKDRKGVMLDGVFIKSTDERYNDAVTEATLRAVKDER